ncbi:MAG: IS200/IS605 family transposase [FCB group bacterium]|jgi:REP element-mobilizing transposase RayT
MPNSYTQLYVHIVIVVKDRDNIILSTFKDNLYKYITSVIQDRGHKLLIINGMSDHVHILVGLNPDESISVLVKELKRNSTNFINNNKFIKSTFSWQSGYGAFSYSRSHLKNVIQYIENQELHHKKKTFREEYIELLEKFSIKYDMEYIFQDVLDKSGTQ